MFGKVLSPNAMSLIKPKHQGSIEGLKQRKALLSELVKDQEGKVTTVQY